MKPAKPNISVKYQQNLTIITFTDKRILEEHKIQAIQTSVFSVIEELKQINLILDFSNVEFLSTAVLGLLIRICKKIYERKGRLVLCSIDEKIYKIFKITRLTKVFDIYADVKTAAKALSTKG